jgi:hypothetical protein
MKAVKPDSTTDILSLVALASIACFISTLCVVASSNPHARNLMTTVFVGLGAGGLILFRQFRKAASRTQISEARARYAATHDALTRLPNKAVFVKRRAKGTPYGRRKGTPFSLSSSGEARSFQLAQRVAAG